MIENLKYYVHKAIWIMLFYAGPFILGYYIFQIIHPTTIFWIAFFLVVWIIGCFISASLFSFLIKKMRSKWEVVENHFLFIEKEDNRY